MNEFESHTIPFHFSKFWRKIPCQFCAKNVIVSKTFSFVFKNLCEKIRKIAKIDKIFDKWHVFGTFLTRPKKPKNPDKMGTFWG